MSVTYPMLSRRIRLCSASHRLRVRGFTLIEIMVVVVIMGVLAALLVPRLMGRTDDARILAARQDIATLMQALKLRKSTREYSDRPIPDQALSELLWAAFGINRPSGDRTAPYWRHIMVIDVYAAMPDGLWLYEPNRHTLIRHPRLAQ